MIGAVAAASGGHIDGLVAGAGITGPDPQQVVSIRARPTPPASWRWPAGPAAPPSATTGRVESQYWNPPS